VKCRAVGWDCGSFEHCPKFFQADENQDERPVCPENRPGLKAGFHLRSRNSTPNPINTMETPGRSSRISVLGHGTPPLLATTHEIREKFWQPPQTAKSIAQSPPSHTQSSSETKARCCHTPNTVVLKFAIAGRRGLSLRDFERIFWMVLDSVESASFPMPRTMMTSTGTRSGTSRSHARWRFRIWCGSGS